MKELVEVESDVKTIRWSMIAKSMGIRSGKQCRERWHQHLRPGLVKGKWTAEEDALIEQLQKQHGNKWSKIAESLPHRTDNDIKNFWFAKQKKIDRHKQKKSNKKNGGISMKRIAIKMPVHRPSKSPGPLFAQKTKNTANSKSLAMVTKAKFPRAPTPSTETPQNTTQIKLDKGGDSAASKVASSKEPVASETPQTPGITFLLGLLQEGKQDMIAPIPPEVPTPPLYWFGINDMLTNVESLPFVSLDSFECTPLHFPGGSPESVNGVYYL